MTTKTEITPLALAAVAALALGSPLEGGSFQGVLTLPSGAHVAVVLLADKPTKRLTHAQAMEWAESVGGVLPARPAAAMLFANAKSEFEDEWHWLSEKYSGSVAWVQSFDSGRQGTDHVGFNHCARAVRMIPLVL